MESVYPFVLAAANYLSPGHDHTILATSIAKRVDAEEPLFAHDEEKLKTAALVIAVDFREGSLGLNVEGDKINGHTTSWCTAQINLPIGGKTKEGWSGPELRDDPDKCIAVQMRMLRTSVRTCSKAPVAHYAVGGERACNNERAIRISNDRLFIAKKLIKIVSHRGDRNVLAKDEK